MTDQIRVRCAPSNTGPDIHTGNARSFLFNFLFAKKHNGAHILRIEDTDRARSKDEYADNILETMRWLGIGPTEGYGTDNQPHGSYKQSERLDQYKEAAEQLISQGDAYYCTCTDEDLEAQRKAIQDKDPKAQFKYPYTCRGRTERPTGKDYVVRFKAPTDGEIVVDDLVFGRIRVPNKENQDFVIMRSNGYPLYNLSVVKDDIDMRITHIIRGRDHLANLVQQMLLFRAFKAEPPKMAHLGMLLSQTGDKLSKRDGSVSISDFRKAGFSKNAILSYLLRLGWGETGDQEMFSMEEMVEKFSFEGCGKKDSKFDHTKLSALNFAYLKGQKLTSDTDYTHHLLPFISQLGLEIDQPSLLVLIPLVRSRAKTFLEAATILQPIISPTITIDPEAAKQHLTPDNRAKLAAFSQALSDVSFWTEQALREKTTEWLADVGLALKDLGPMSRTALVGRTTSPELFQTMWALGRQKTIERLGAR